MRGCRRGRPEIFNRDQGSLFTSERFTGGAGGTGYRGQHGWAVTKDENWRKGASTTSPLPPLEGNNDDQRQADFDGLNYG